MKPKGLKASTSSDKAAPRRGLHDQLHALGLTREQDLVLHLPLRYEDHTRVVSIVDLHGGMTALTEGVVLGSSVEYRPRRQLVATLRGFDDHRDGNGLLTLRFFHFYPNTQKSLAVGAQVRVFGEVREGHFGREIVHPQFKVVEQGAPLPDRLTPVYPTTAGLGQETLRKVIARALAADPGLIAETLPTWLIEKRRLWTFADAVGFLHAPPPRFSEAVQRALDERTHPAWTRIKFDELIAQQLSLKAHRKSRAEKHAPVLTGTGTLTGALLERVPFSLTGAQQRVWREIRSDLARSTPMQRLLQGDVGSGKTIVAALAALQAIESGRQVAFMAPTEILAEQHYRKLTQWLDGLGVGVAWLSGSLRAKERKATLDRIASGEANFVVGTHALFEDDVLLPRLGLAIVDEQHRFGVAQRLKLRGKAIGEAHQLMMSATPIPRTLAMTFYADLDVSVLDEMPPGRTPVATRLVKQARRAEVIERVRRACVAGRQAYWVCPLIEESEKLELQTAVALHAELCAVFAGGVTGADVEVPAAPAEGATAPPAGTTGAEAGEVSDPAPAPPRQLRAGLLHGRMKPDEKAAVMAEFVAGAVDVLVATTVIEVGVDVPNATLMAIEHAERFGLAQLHQLRGRVGRGAAESTCYLLFEEPLSDTAKARLKVIYENTDGFEIARQDLLIRGPGEFLGARQSGAPMLRFADIERDVELIEAARDAADELLRRDPVAAAAHLERWLGGKAEFIKA